MSKNVNGVAGDCGVKGQESDIYKIQNLKYKQQDIIRNLS